MKCGEIRNLLEPFRIACDANSLVPEHRMIQVNPDNIVAKTGMATMVSNISLGLDKPFATEVRPLAGIAGSLPDQAELELEFEDNALAWKCGKARGRFATKPPFQTKPQLMPKMPNDSFESSQTLSSLFELGAIACSNSALQTVGLYGMVIEPAGKNLWAVSSDGMTIAVAKMAMPRNVDITKRMTVTPPVAPLLALMAQQRRSQCAFTERAIEFDDPTYRTSINLAAPLKHDLYGTAKDLLTDKQGVHDLNRERINLFTKRTYLLAEARIKAAVVVKVEDEQLTLEFNEAFAQSEEVYPITEGFKVDHLVSVTVDAIKLSKALQHCDQMLFDNMPRMMVFRAKNSSFYYIVSGKAEGAND